MHYGFFLRGDPAPAADDLQQHKGDTASVQHRQRQDVDDRQVDGEERRELQQRLPAGLLHYLPGGLGDADGPGDVGAGAALDHGDHLVAGEDQRVDGGGPALGERLPGREALLLRERVQGADLDAGGTLALGGRPAGVDGNRKVLAAAGREGPLYVEVHGFADVEADRQADLAHVAHLIAVDGADDVAGLQAGLLGRALGGHAGDLGQAHVHFTRDHEGDGEEEDRQQEVHTGAGEQDDQ